MRGGGGGGGGGGGRGRGGGGGGGGSGGGGGGAMVVGREKGKKWGKLGFAVTQLHFRVASACLVLFLWIPKILVRDHACNFVRAVDVVVVVVVVVTDHRGGGGDDDGEMVIRPNIKTDEEDKKSCIEPPRIARSKEVVSALNSISCPSPSRCFTLHLDSCVCAGGDASEEEVAGVARETAREMAEDELNICSSPAQVERGEGRRREGR
eukprot:750683-Hanusia_phi.AAC.2